MRAAALCCLTMVALGAGADAGKDWWAHVTFLADDGLEGRKAGTPGHRKAAEYVAGQFEKLNLKPVGYSYFQPVKFTVRQIDESRSSLALITGNDVQELKLGTVANLGLLGDPGQTVEAEVVFAGYGLNIPEYKIDDLNGLDVKGKIVMYLRGQPYGVPGPIASHAQSSAERWRLYREAGAIGVTSFIDPRISDISWERSTPARLQPSLTLADRQLADNVGQQIAITINPAHVDRFLAGTGHTVAQLLDLHWSHQPLPKFSLKSKIRVKSQFSVQQTSSDNVIGVLPGSDAGLRDEYVVICAHLDHLGVGRPINGDGLYNGAMDNASGVASVLELAKVLSNKKPKRSILFAAVTGEEGGLMGSKFLAAYPVIAAGKVIANINLDMFLPIIPLRAITVFGFDESTLGTEFAQVAKSLGVISERDPEPQRNAFTRSDQYSFIRRGIPAVTFKFYAAPGTPEAKIMNNWRRQRYHAPSDDLNQPVNLEGAAKFNDILAAFAERVSNNASRPTWKPESFFRRYASD